ncbi:MAG: hypothetical protein ACFFDI_32520, partial [Promethearchaeota archaeon]
DEEVKEVKAFLEKYGGTGYDDSQSIIVFKQRCANNVPQFLWKSNPNWSPLFPRYLEPFPKKNANEKNAE